jgi:hypothetical protein
MPRMSKRIAAGILWFLAAWYLGAWIALFLGISDVLGPILGLAAAAVFAGDPLGIIWVKRAEPATVRSLDLENLPDDLAQAA